MAKQEAITKAIRLAVSKLSTLSEVELKYRYEKLGLAPAENNKVNLKMFRNLRSGQFYWQPFLSRTIIPLTKRFGNDVELLKKKLNKFDWKEINIGDFGAKIHALGNVFITLVYHHGDKEFSPEFSVFFDSSINRAFNNTEDTVVLTSRICIGLLY